MPSIDSHRQFHFGRSTGFQTGVTPISERELRMGRRPQDTASAARTHLLNGGRKLGSWSPDGPNENVIVQR